MEGRRAWPGKLDKALLCERHYLAINTPMRVDEVIKLGGGNNDKASAFMRDLDDLSDAHPFHPRQRIIGGATVEVSPTSGRNQVHIHDVLSLEPNKGHATRAMGILKKLADKHNVVLDLFAKAYSNSPSHITDTEQLVRWYQKLGFEITDDYDPEILDDGVEMRYYP